MGPCVRRDDIEFVWAPRPNWIAPMPTANPFDLSGKVAIVTGGNGGIGLGMARGLAEAGAAIAVVGRNEGKSNAAVAELQQCGVKAISVTADVTDKAAVTDMAARVSRELGRIDILVNNAGINIRKPPHALALDEWDSVIKTNLTSAFLCSQAVYPAMKQHPGQCGAAGLDRHRSYEARAPGDRRPARQGSGPHPGGAMGRNRRLRRHRGIPEFGSVRLRHRHGDPR